MRCERVRELLDAYRTGELEPGELEKVEVHVHECEECAGALVEIRTISRQASAGRPEAPAAVLRFVLGEAVDHYGDVDTDLGRFWVGYGPHGIRMLLMKTSDPGEFEQAYRLRMHRTPRRADLPARFGDLVRSAVEGRETGPIPVDLSGLAAFERSVLETLRQIPAGEVRTYSWLAREAGRPAAVRAVGNAMARNPVPVLLPCHRVVPVQGGVGNYAFGSDVKKALLSREGVPVEELEQLRVEGIRFIGSDTTHIYCFPTCRAARRIGREHRVAFHGAAEAAASGYRPCLLCRP